MYASIVAPLTLSLSCSLTLRTPSPLLPPLPHHPISPPPFGVVVLVPSIHPVAAAAVHAQSQAPANALPATFHGEQISGK